MKLRKLIIKNFRGIRELEWLPEDDELICLIGHGDSTKSTILQAIEYLLYPRYYLQLSDTDFYYCDPDSYPISIEAILGDLPESITNDDFLNAHFVFWDKTTKTLSSSELHETDDKSIKISLDVDYSLEPIWNVVGESGVPEEIRHKKREKLNMMRLDSSSERDFKWGYNTILSKITEKKGKGELRTILAKAGRVARKEFKGDDLSPDFKASADVISEEAKMWGVGHDSFKPYLDVFSAESLCLNDENNVPVYMLGNGSKKLLLTSMEKVLVLDSESPEEHIILMDEIENGLEPHRLIHVIFTLREIADKSKSQVFIATHSPVSLTEVAGRGTYRVNNLNGAITIEKIDTSKTPQIRKNPYAFFMKKIIICEGRTEVGLLRKFKKQWIEEKYATPEHFGVYFVDGGGDPQMTQCAKIYKEFDYDVCVYGDNDRGNEDSEDITYYRYKQKVYSEQAICKDAPEQLILDIVDYCKNIRRNDVPNKSITEEYRMELAGYLHDQEIFRRIDTAEKFGEMILPYYEQMKDGDFFQTIDAIKTWIYT